MRDGTLVLAAEHERGVQARRVLGARLSAASSAARPSASAMAAGTAGREVSGARTSAVSGMGLAVSGVSGAVWVT
jgi:hypothetical protein